MSQTHPHQPGLDHRGPFRAGDLVQLTDPKGRHHTFELHEGKQFFTNKGSLDHDELIGSDEGVVMTSSGGTQYLALRPMLRDFVLSMKRGAAIIYPKDAATILGLADVFPGAHVVEAGVGSGALTCSLLRSVGTTGTVRSWEIREDFAAVARRNVERWFGGPVDNWQLRIGPVQDDLPDIDADVVILDMLAPWECVDGAWQALVPGGVLIGYVATTTQMSMLVETLREHGGWTEPLAQESLLRTWHLEGLAVRPDHRMQGHTAFLVSTRRLADGVRAPLKRSRPAKGAYGADYRGPGAQTTAGTEPSPIGDSE